MSLFLAVGMVLNYDRITMLNLCPSVKDRPTEFQNGKISFIPILQILFNVPISKEKTLYIVEL